jgi:hypothetical protein
VQKRVKNRQKKCFLSHFYAKIGTFKAKTRPFLPKKRSKRVVKTAFLGVFRAFLGLKVYHLYQVFQLQIMVHPQKMCTSSSHPTLPEGRAFKKERS